MANTAAICNSFKEELMQGFHVFEGVNPARTINTVDTFKLALYLASATYNYDTTAYSATGEVGNSGTYSAGGATLTNGNTVGIVTGASGKAYWTPSANVSFTGFSATAFDAALLYNSSQSNRAVAVFTFGSQTISSGTFTLTMPTNDGTTGLIRIA